MCQVAYGRYIGFAFWQGRLYLWYLQITVKVRVLSVVSRNMEIEMKIFRKSTALLMSFILCLSLTGCKSSEGTEDKNKYKLTIMTTLFPYYDFVRAVVGNEEDICVELLMSPGQDSHSFEPTPSDIIQIDDADVFIYNGGSIENWVEEVIASLNNQSQVQMKMMDCLDEVADMNAAYENEQQEEAEQQEATERIYAVEDHNHEEYGHTEEEELENHEEHLEQGSDEHHHEEEVDEHIWTSPVYAMSLVQNICDKLCEIMPEKKSVFQNNTLNYVNQIKDIDYQFKEIVKSSKHKEIIFADKFPLKYFAEEYGLKYYAAFPGCSSDAEPSAKTVAFLIDKVKDKDVNGVFYLELSSQTMADVICDDTNVKKYQFNSCHNITQKQFDSGVTYIDLMKENVQALKSALK